MGLFNKVKDVCKPPVMTLQKYRPTFTTVDGEEHLGCIYKWAKASGLLCSVPEYIMHSVKSNGYLDGKDKVMYPLTNIISIKWNMIDEKKVYEDYSNRYRIFLTDEEVNEFKEVES